MRSMIASGVLLVLFGLTSQSFGQQYGVSAPVPIGTDSYRSTAGGSYAYPGPYDGYNQVSTVPQGPYSTPDPRFQEYYEPTYEAYPTRHRPVGGFFNRVMELERRKNQWLFGRPSLFY